jgi:hypothetical protein
LQQLVQQSQVPVLFARSKQRCTNSTRNEVNATSFSCHQKHVMCCSRPCACHDTEDRQEMMLASAQHDNDKGNDDDKENHNHSYNNKDKENHNGKDTDNEACI